MYFEKKVACSYVNEMIRCLESLHYRAGPLKHLCITATFGKIWSACEQHKIQYTELKTNRQM